MTTRARVLCSGEIRIRAAYDERLARRSVGSHMKEGYRVEMQGPEGCWRGIVYAPAVGFRGKAYDSLAAYLSTARAALAFAEDEKRGFTDAAEYGRSGYVVRSYRKEALRDPSRRRRGARPKRRASRCSCRRR
jgi:hypothetical protein